MDETTPDITHDNTHDNTHDYARPDLHNSEVDEAAAARRLCGMTFLNNGHICMLPERHAGGCEFVDPHTAVQ
jgi:hypothetical protein